MLFTSKVTLITGDPVGIGRAAQMARRVAGVLVIRP